MTLAILLSGSLWGSATRAVAVPPLSLESFDATTRPRNGDGVPLNGGNDGPVTYPFQGAPNDRGEGGIANLKIESTGCPVGKCLTTDLTSGELYLWWAPFNFDRDGRYDDLPAKGFARSYSDTPSEWQFNTYNRLSFYVKTPVDAQPLRTDYGQNLQFGTYVKRVANADGSSDETGGGHYYHYINVPPTGGWAKVILNMHPSHRRGESGATEWDNVEHPTGEPNYNYWDTLTSFYYSYPYSDGSNYKTRPAQFKLDELTFYKEPHPENDKEIYSILATHDPTSNRLVVTWNGHKRETVRHELRYAFQDIHEIGWSKATPAPGGILVSSEDDSSLIYETTAIPLAGQDTVYLAIRVLDSTKFPELTNLFSQITLPLNLNRPPGLSSPTAPRNIRIAASP